MLTSPVQKQVLVSILMRPVISELPILSKEHNAGEMIPLPVLNNDQNTPRIPRGCLIHA
jgi:hypothetical protein